MGALPLLLDSSRRFLSLVKKFLIETLLLLLAGTFLLLLCFFFAPSFGRFLGFPTILLLGGVFFVLGLLLVRTTRKRKVEGRLRRFLMLTGVSAAGFLSGVVLHNFFYALGVLFGGVLVLRYLMEAIHIVFFLASVFAAPLGFLVGIVGSVILLLKKRRRSS
jgi:hypothetical protein